MREILFRGKPVSDGEYYFFSQIWKDSCKDGFVYGSLVVDGDRYYICVSAMRSINTCINNGTTSMIEVMSETVGQYTGLNSKNKKKIFDGDILLAPNKKKAIVSFGTYSPYISSDADTFECWKLKVGDNECPLTKSISVELEIIGNIYDNSELIS